MTHRDRLRRIGLAAGLVAWLAGLPVGATQALPWTPAEPTDQPWLVGSLLEDGALSGRNLFNLDFERDRSSPRHGTAWIATSDGLVEYDGYTWRRFGRVDGLPSDFVRCVRVTRSGDIWVGTDSGAGIFNGASFRTLGSDTGLAGPNVRRIVEDPDGTLWFCSDSWPKRVGPGGLTSFRDGKWTAYGTKDGLPGEYVLNYFRASDGSRYVSTFAGPAQWNGQRWIPLALPKEVEVPHWGSGIFAESPELGVILFTGRILFARRPTGWQVVHSGFENGYGLVVTEDGRILSCGPTSRDHRAIVEWTPDGWVRRSAEFTLPLGYNEGMREAPDGSIWVVGYDSLWRWQRRGSQWREFPEVPPPDFVDASGRVWFFSPPTTSHPPSPPVRLDGTRWERLDAAFRHLQCDRRGTVWGWASNHVARWQDSESTRFEVAALGWDTLETGASDHRGFAWSFGRLPGGALAAARFDGTRWEDVALPPGTENARILLHGPATEGVWVVLQRPDQTNALATLLDREPKEPIPIPGNLLGLFAPRILADAAQRHLWLLGGGGLARWTRGESTAWEPIAELPGRQVVAGVDRDDGTWFACSSTHGGTNGLIRFFGGRRTPFYLDSVLGLDDGPDGTLLVSAFGGARLISADPNPVPFPLSLPTAHRVLRTIGDRSGRLWLGDGVSLFLFSKDGVPPDTRIMAGPAEVISGRTAEFHLQAIERFQPRNQGTDHRFSWRIDDGPWSAFAAGPNLEIETTGLTYGPHRLEVRARDSGGDIDPRPAMLEFRVFPVPLQSRPWFLPVLGGSSLLFAALAFFASGARARLAKHAHELQAAVDRQTAKLREDLDQRIRTEQALRESQAQLRHFVSRSPTILYALRIESDGLRLVWISDNAASLFGSPVPEPAGIDAWLDLIHPDDRGRIRAAHATPYTLEHQVLEFRFRRADGIYLWIRDEKRLVRDDHGNPTEIIGTCTDITERMDLEAKLRQAQRMEAIGQLSAGIAHEFNNILGAILGNAQLAQLDTPSDHPARRCIDEIVGSGIRARGLIRQILNITKPPATERQLVSLREVLEESVQLLRATLPAGVDIGATFADDPPKVLADATQIEQVILNLGTNAWHSLDGSPGRIRLGLDAFTIDDSNAAAYPDLKPGLYARLSVSHTGRTLDSATLERVFEPSFAPAPAGEGSGLALSVAHGIVKSHQGAITVSNRPEQGTTFHVLLPASAATEPRSAETNDRTSTPRRGTGQHILYVDDEPALVSLVTRLLERLGYRVSGFSNPMHALVAFQSVPEQFQLVITDLNMPEVSGLAVAERVLRSRPGIPVVLTSGHLSEDLKQQARDLGIRELVYKPGLVERLIQTVERLLGEPRPR